ncbi:MAG: amidohydrolase family protein [Proteobacteria bacterium]|nr:amidohydrolase family protein [Pseudomonadota bacterium]
MTRYLRSGVTSVADVGGPYWNFAVRERSRTHPTAPRVSVTGPLVSSVSRDQLGRQDPPIIRAQTSEQARALVRKQLSHRPDYIKFWLVVSKTRAASEFAPLLRAAIDEAHRHGLRAFVHATGLEAARLAVNSGADVLVHSVKKGEVDADFIALLKRRNVVYITTLLVFERYQRTFWQQFDFEQEEHAWGDPHVLGSLLDLQHLNVDKLVPGFIQKRRARGPPAVPDVALKNLKRLHDAGVTIAVGTDAGNIGIPHGPAIFAEFALMRKAGLTPEQILRAATAGGAAALGSSETGVLKVGALADLLILDRDPRVDIRNTAAIHRVVKGGELIDPSGLLRPSPAQVVQRQLNAYNLHDVDRFVATYAQDAEIYRGDRLRLKGRTALRENYSSYFEASPNLHCQILRRVVQGPYVVDQERITGARGRAAAKFAHSIYEVRHGLIQRVWFDH